MGTSVPASSASSSKGSTRSATRSIRMPAVSAIEDGSPMCPATHRARLPEAASHAALMRSRSVSSADISAFSRGSP